MDTHEGEQDEPLSLHKYLYCEANPVNNVDPSGHEIEGTVDLSGAIGDIAAQISTYKVPSDYVYYGALHQFTDGSDRLALVRALGEHCREQSKDHAACCAGPKLCDRILL